MFGKNPVERAENNGGTSLRVVDGTPFFTIQGEGPFSGKSAVFLRLHGCPLRCYFCDTEFSRPEDPYVPVEDIITMIREIAPQSCGLLVITGGEPVRQNLAALVSLVYSRLPGWIIQVETSGILWQECLHETVVICSPKTPTIHHSIFDHAHSFKYVIRAGEIDGTDGLPLTNTQIENGKPQRLARPRPGADVYLSPMDECDPAKNALNLAEVSRIAREFPYRAGVQLHKLMDLP
jgi:7-carboxy-7-deazaguanine synthase